MRYIINNGDVIICGVVRVLEVENMVFMFEVGGNIDWFRSLLLVY